MLSSQALHSFEQLRLLQREFGAMILHKKAPQLGIEVSFKGRDSKKRFQMLRGHALHSFWATSVAAIENQER
jgi:hypothetical protein